MSDPKDHDTNASSTRARTPEGERPEAADGGRDGGGRADAPEAGTAGSGATGEGTGADAALDQEVDILRGEMSRLQQQLEEARSEAGDFRDRYLRSRAELENFRRRAADDLERAREAGLDSAVLTVLTVFDDLGRALQAAEATDDPASIVPGVRAVKASLERNLETLDIRPIGQPGETFDPNQHEALTAVPTTEGAEPGTIADVFQAGFKRGERLVRPARVVVYKEPE